MDEKLTTNSVSHSLSRQSLIKDMASTETQTTSGGDGGGGGDGASTGGVLNLLKHRSQELTGGSDVGSPDWLKRMGTRGFLYREGWQEQALARTALLARIVPRRVHLLHRPFVIGYNRTQSRGVEVGA